MYHHFPSSLFLDVFFVVSILFHVLLHPKDFLTQ